MSINQDLEQTGLLQRCALIVYLDNVSDQYRLRRFGDIVYFSKKLDYCILYVAKKKAEVLQQKINQLSFVNKVDLSKKDTLDFSTEHIEGQIGKMAKVAETKLEEKKHEASLK